MSQFIEIKGVQSAEVEAVWEKVKPLIEDALQYDGGFTNIERIKERLLSSEEQLWVIHVDGELDAVCITCINHYAEFTALDIPIFSGGKPHFWMEALYDVFSRFAKENGCSKIISIARVGWKPLLKSIGCKSDMMLFVKEI